MAAGLGFKTFTTGEVLTAGDVNGYLMQGINVFASNAARDAAITAPQEGQFAYTKDTNSLWYYSGSAWVASGATGDIEGVTAGVGISGGGTSGTVTVTNSMATAIDAKGDLVPGTGADTFSRLAVGANGTVLTADSAEATGLKWATSAGGGMTLLSTTTLSGSSTTISSISGSYKNLHINIQNIDTVSATSLRLLINGSTYTSVQYVLNGSTSTLNRATSAQFIGTVNLNASSDANNWVFDIYDYTKTNISHVLTYSGVYLNSDGSTCKLGASGSSDAYAAITSITIDTNGGGNFQGGTVFLYGVN